MYDTRMPPELVSVFEYWYGNQSNVCKIPGYYFLSVQVGVCSEAWWFNFHQYYSTLTEGLSSTPAECYVDCVSVNNINYADGMVL